MVYYRDNFGIVSDKREHNDLVVHKFIQVGVNSSLSHIHYLSDEADSQYKNYTIFTNFLQGCLQKFWKGVRGLEDNVVPHST